MSEDAGPTHRVEPPGPIEGEGLKATGPPTIDEQRKRRRLARLILGPVLLGVSAFMALRMLNVQRHLATVPVILAGIYIYRIYLRIAPKLPEYRPYFETLTVDRPGSSWLSAVPAMALAVLAPAAVNLALRSGFSNLSSNGQVLALVTGILAAWVIGQALNKGYGNETQLWRAAMNGNTRAVRRLLAAGANPNELDPNGNPALVWPVFSANRKLLILLLEAGARPDSTVYATRKGEPVQVTLRELALNNEGTVPNSGRRSFYTEIALILEKAETPTKNSRHPVRQNSAQLPGSN